jgi:hypothetical protein
VHLYGKVPLEPNVLVKVAGPFWVAEAVHACGLLVLVTLCALAPVTQVQITRSPADMFVAAGTNAKFTMVTPTVAPKPQNGTDRHNKVAAAPARKLFNGFFNEDFMFVKMNPNEICSRKNSREQLTRCALSALMPQYG